MCWGNGNSCIWLVIIVILLFSCGGWGGSCNNGCGNECGNSCGCC